MDSHATRPRRALHRLAIASTAIGGTLAIALMLVVGRNNPSRLLLSLFALWVLIPFAMLLGAYTRATAWPASTRTTLDVLMVSVPVVMVSVYANVALGPDSARHARLFVLVPPVASLLVVATLSVTLLLHRSRRGRVQE